MKFISTIFVIVVFFAFTSSSIGQVDWTKYPHNPVLDKGISGSLDSYFVIMPTVLISDSVYHMWYCYGNSQNLHYIGHALSNDGINWKKDSLNNPVLGKGPSGSWDAYGVSVPCVIKIDSLYHMWYKGYSTSSAPAGHGAIGHAISNDGINWTKDTLNSPVLDVGVNGEWDDTWVSNGSVIFDGNIYHMWYHAYNGIGEQVQIGHAISPHPDSAWTKDPNNPVLSYESGKWDYPRVDAPQVTFDGTIFHMWYAGGIFFKWRIGYATSSDGTVWIKDSLNPVLDWGLTNEWDDYGVSFCSILFDTEDKVYKMWYSGFDETWSGRIGYATAQSLPDGLPEQIFTFTPKNYVLSQNYPNPFNPSTTIEFTLPKSEFVELKVYNILGKEISTLVSNKLNQGNHTYTFDGKNLASGIYYYQLTAGEYREVKKMILLR